jgi:hypothetical protein
VEAGWFKSGSEGRLTGKLPVWAKKRAGKLQYFIGTTQFLDLAFEFLEAFLLGCRRSFALVGISFVLAHPRV